MHHTAAVHGMNHTAAAVLCEVQRKQCPLSAVAIVLVLIILAFVAMHALFTLARLYLAVTAVDPGEDGYIGDAISAVTLALIHTMLCVAYCAAAALHRLRGRILTEFVVTGFPNGFTLKLGTSADAD